MGEASQIKSCPPVSQRLVDHLKVIFRPIDVTPRTSQQEVMFSAGEQKVLAWLAAVSEQQHDEDSHEQLSKLAGAARSAAAGAG